MINAERKHNGNHEGTRDERQLQRLPDPEALRTLLFDRQLCVCAGRDRLRAALGRVIAVDRLLRLIALALVLTAVSSAISFAVLTLIV